MTEPSAESAAAEKDAVEAKISELDILRQSLQAAQAKSADYYDQLLRLKAEFENFRKRTEKDRAPARFRAAPSTRARGLHTDREAVCPRYS